METSVNNITINGQEYILKDPLQPAGRDVRIVILQRGWVMVGYYYKIGENCQLLNASVIRNWGSTKGLGEIAHAGPTSSTSLDPTNGTVEFHELTIVATIKANEGKWQKHLS